MSENDEETKNLIAKKLVEVIGNMSETLQGLVEKIEFSNRQMALLTKKVEEMAVKVKQLDSDVEEEFTKLGKEPTQKKDYTGELKEIEKGLAEIPDDILDDELKGLLEEEEKQEKIGMKQEKSGKKKEKK
jgi:hypothetical protein